MLPTAFQKMRANRELTPRPVAPSRAEILRINRRKAGETAVRGLVRKINRMEQEMVAEWHALRIERTRAGGFDDTIERLRGWSEQAAPTRPAPRRSWWPPIMWPAGWG